MAAGCWNFRLWLSELTKARDDLVSRLPTSVLAVPLVWTFSTDLPDVVVNFTLTAGLPNAAHLNLSTRGTTSILHSLVIA